VIQVRLKFLIIFLDLVRCSERTLLKIKMNLESLFDYHDCRYNQIRIREKFSVNFFME
jgi:hypothetical protein